jgi:hypothetical protein
MRHTPGAAVERRRVGRLLRSIDAYVVFAALGVIAYIAVVNLVAEIVSMDIQDNMETQQARAAAEGAAAVLPAEVYWPHMWPSQPLAELSILREGKTFVEKALTRLAPLLKELPAAQLAAWDLLLLAGTKTELKLSSTELQRVVKAALPPSTSAATGATYTAVREAVESAAAAWAVKGMADEVAEADRIRKELLTFPSPPVLSINTRATSWAEFSSAVWDVVTRVDLRESSNFEEVYQQVLNVSGQYWMPAERGGLLPPLADHYLLPLQSGSYDTVVPLTRLLLHLWVIGGGQDAMLVAAYDAAVEAVLQNLLHTRTVGEGDHAMNYTFVASAAEHVVPVATPRSCALSGLLAQGVRYGAHRYPARPATRRYSEDDVLQAAETLAASCFQQYADPAGHRLRGSVYVTSSGPVAGYSKQPPPTAPDRSTFCDIPALLLESFHELYLTTEDAMYGLWSLLIMSDGTSDHCSVSAHDVRGGNSGNDGLAWRRYARELRSLWLLLHRMDCLVYRRSRGTRGLCEVTTTTMVSGATGHLLRVPPQKTS